jgi:hypothetical protein
VKSGKYRGLFEKRKGLPGLTGIDPADSIGSVGSRSDGGWRWFDQGRWIWIQRPWTRVCARPPASGGGRRRPAAVKRGTELGDRFRALIAPEGGARDGETI